MTDVFMTEKYIIFIICGVINSNFYTNRVNIWAAETRI